MSRLYCKRPYIPPRKDSRAEGMRKKKKKKNRVRLLHFQSGQLQSQRT